jgi:hypothetical protein
MQRGGRGIMLAAACMWGNSNLPEGSRRGRALEQEIILPTLTI